MNRRRMLRIVLAVLALVGLIALGFARGGPDREDAGFADLSRGDIGEAAPDDATVGVGGSGSVSAGGGDMGASRALTPVEEDAATTPSAGGYRERIVKDGRMEIEVPRGRFDQAFGAALELARRVDGQVVSSRSRSDGDASDGEVTIRVPAERFEDLLLASGGIGEVRAREITSQDVTGEFTDLQSRLRHLRAQERFYLELLAKAQTVGDAIGVNEQLSRIQGELEQVQGRLQLLDERSTYSRLTLHLFEPGQGVVTGFGVPRDGVLTRAWQDALRGLQETLGALLVGLFTMAPLAVLALLLWALWRTLRPRRAGQDPQPAPAEHQGPLPVE